MQHEQVAQEFAFEVMAEVDRFALFGPWEHTLVVPRLIKVCRRDALVLRLAFEMCEPDSAQEQWVAAAMVWLSYRKCS